MSCGLRSGNHGLAPFVMFTPTLATIPVSTGAATPLDSVGMKTALPTEHSDMRDLLPVVAHLLWEQVHDLYVCTSLDTDHLSLCLCHKPRRLGLCLSFELYALRDSLHSHDG